MEVASGCEAESRVPQLVRGTVVGAGGEPAGKSAEVGGAIDGARATVVESSQRARKGHDGFAGNLGEPLDGRDGGGISDEPGADAGPAGTLLGDPGCDRVLGAQRGRQIRRAGGQLDEPMGPRKLHRFDAGTDLVGEAPELLDEPRDVSEEGLLVEDESFLLDAVRSGGTVQLSNEAVGLLGERVERGVQVV